MSEIALPQKRIAYLDVLKFLAMYLVIWGHTTQYGLAHSIENGTFHPFAYINNSFHMPLFMTISGIFAASSLKYSFWQLLRNKFLQLLLPAFVWSGVAATILFFRGKNWWELYGWVGIIWDYWFVKCLFLCYLLYWLSIRLLRSEVLSCVVSLLIVLSLDFCSVLWLNVMLPFFWLGHFMKKRFTTEGVDGKWIILLALLFVVLLLFWSADYTIYANGANFASLLTLTFRPHNLFVHCYRFLTGAVGATLFILLVQKLFPLVQGQRWVSYLERYGRETFAIYMVHVLAIVTLASFYAFPEGTNAYLFDFLYAHLYNLAALAISIVVIEVFSKWRWSRLLFLGKTW